MTQPNTSPRRGVRRFEQLNEGWSYCYECGGDGACVTCDGSGKNEGKPCTTCGAIGFCRLCDGEGQLPPPKTPLEFVGLYRELGFAERSGFPSLIESRGTRPAEHKAEVVAYLLAGKTMVFSPGGWGKDVFDPTKSTTTRAILTDGRYAWWKELAYYVEHYDVALTEAFEKHIAENGFKIPPVDTSKLTLGRG